MTNSIKQLQINGQRWMANGQHIDRFTFNGNMEAFVEYMNAREKYDFCIGETNYSLLKRDKQGNFIEVSAMTFNELMSKQEFLDRFNKSIRITNILSKCK